MVDREEDIDYDEEQMLAKYIVSLSVKDKELISDLSIDIDELLLFQIDEFDYPINKPRPDLDQQQQNRRIEIIRQISNLQACERVQKEGRTHPDNYNFKVGSGNGGNNEIIELQLSPVLKQSRIVTSFVLYASKKTIELLLNHKYESKTVIFPVDIDKASFNWTKFTEDFETKLKNKGIGQEHITMLADSLDENWKKISDLLHKNNEDSDDSSDEGKSAAQIALDLAEEHCSELFVDQFGTQ